jgi:hypothetical protein
MLIVAWVVVSLFILLFLSVPFWVQRSDRNGIGESIFGTIFFWGIIAIIIGAIMFFCRCLAYLACYYN